MDKRTYSASDLTKQALCLSLKQLMVQKPLEKISIREITDGCGMKRQNFYYHFEDIYALVNWMFQQEAMALLARYEGEQLWQDGILRLLHYLEENRTVCLCALRSMGRSQIKSLFKSELYAIVHRTICLLAQQLEIDPARLDTDALASYYSIALAGVMESWILGELGQRTPEQLVQFADTMLQDHIRGVTARLKSAQS